MTAIEIIGTGKRTRYALKAFTTSGSVPLLPGVAFRTEDAARQRAAALGLTVAVVGDLWECLHAVRTEATP